MQKKIWPKGSLMVSLAKFWPGNVISNWLHSSFSRFQFAPFWSDPQGEKMTLRVSLAKSLACVVCRNFGMSTGGEIISSEVNVFLYASWNKIKTFNYQ